MSFFLYTVVYLNKLTYGTINIDGEIDGVEDLDIGSGVDVLLGEMVKHSINTLLHTVKILKFGTPQTIAIIVLRIEKFDVSLH